MIKKYGRYDVVASGSLLGLSFGQDTEVKEEIVSIAVGYEKEIEMHPIQKKVKLKIVIIYCQDSLQKKIRNLNIQR